MSHDSISAHIPTFWLRSRAPPPEREKKMTVSPKMMLNSKLSKQHPQGCRQSRWWRSSVSLSGGICPVLKNSDRFQLISCFHEKISKEIDSCMALKI
jgi:hypothetical protein